MNCREGYVDMPLNDHHRYIHTLHNLSSCKNKAKKSVLMADVMGVHVNPIQAWICLSGLTFTAVQ